MWARGEQRGIERGARTRTRRAARGEVAIALASMSLVLTLGLGTRALAQESVNHTIQNGESLWGIARQYDCTIDQLRRANDLTGDTIYAGRTLEIPDCSDGASDVERQAEDEAEAERTYLIRPGDYLEGIAEELGCSVAELMSANDLHDDVIYAGRRLVVPECTPRDPGEAGENSYIIQPGDYLGAIARRFGCTVGEIRAANGIRGDVIRAGEALTIPECFGEGRAVSGREIDTRQLRRLMDDHGFDPPRRFRALIVEITFNDRRSRVVRERWFAYDEDSISDDDWNPASSVKLYAAIAALQKARRLGFSGNARVTFHGNSDDYDFILNELIREALTPSNNIAYNFLVQFVGFDELHEAFFTAGNGFSSSALRRAYERRHWMEMGESPSFRESPSITIEEGGRTRTLEARRGSADTACSGAACTTLVDLAECLRRLMLQEQLDEAETFRLPREDLLTVRLAMRAERTRGEEVVEHLARSISGEDVYFYHKAGYAGRWYSDNVYIYDPHADQAWIVTLAGYPGRDSLDEAAAVIGEIIASGELRALSSP